MHTSAVFPVMVEQIETEPPIEDRSFLAIAIPFEQSFQTLGGIVSGTSQKDNPLTMLRRDLFEDNINILRPPSYRTPTYGFALSVRDIEDLYIHGDRSIPDITIEVLTEQIGHSNPNRNPDTAKAATLLDIALLIDPNKVSKHTSDYYTLATQLYWHGAERANNQDDLELEHDAHYMLGKSFGAAMAESMGALDNGALWPVASSAMRPLYTLYLSKEMILRKQSGSSMEGGPFSQGAKYGAYQTLRVHGKVSKEVSFQDWCSQIPGYLGGFV